jgi:uncharacterized membrane protein YvbJ
MKCEKCGATNLEINLRCRLCGHGFNSVSSSPQEKQIKITDTRTWNRKLSLMKIKHEAIKEARPDSEFMRGFEFCMKCFE